MEDNDGGSATGLAITLHQFLPTRLLKGPTDGRNCTKASLTSAPITLRATNFVCHILFRVRSEFVSLYLPCIVLAR